jgi:hypothetical protein
MATTDPTRTQTPYGGLSKDYEISLELGAMARRRQGTLTEETINLYVEDLKRFNLDDIRAVLRTFGGTMRVRGETAIPEIGALISECERLLRFRHEPDSDGWMIYRCQRCGVQQVGPPKACTSCGGFTEKLVSATEPFNHAEYMADVRRNPQNYVKVSDCLKIAAENVRRRAK